MKRAAAHKGVGEFFRNGAKNCLNMWFGVLPTVMCIGTAALVVANYTPVFDWLGMPFRPLLSALQVPDVAAAASTMVVHRCGGFRNPGAFPGRSRRTDSQLQAANQPVRTVPHLPGANHYFSGNRLPDCPSVVLIRFILFRWSRLWYTFIDVRRICINKLKGRCRYVSQNASLQTADYR